MTQDVLLGSAWKGKVHTVIVVLRLLFPALGLRVPPPAGERVARGPGSEGSLVGAVGAAEEAKMGRTVPLPSPGSRTQTANALLWSGRPTWAPPCPAHKALELAGALVPERPHWWNEDGTGPYSPPASPES